MKYEKRLWVGWVLTVLAALPFLPSAAMKLVGGPQLAEGMAHLGWPVEAKNWLGSLELLVAITYLIPRTAVIGGILLTGYIGGAMATHLRIGEPVFLHVALGLALWGGLYLREPRLQALLPLTRRPR